MKIISIFVMTSLLIAAPMLLSSNVNVFAQNTASQIIAQSQFAKQLGICVSGDGTLFSCNNLNVQDQQNTGNNAAAQSGSGGSGGGNEAFQGIGQFQSSNQGALCVSGEGTFISCNNLNFQNQNNEGSNALAQQSGSGGKGGGNEASQSISQQQSSNQDSLVASGGDTVASGNNLNFQNQENTGNNAAAQQSGSDGKGGGNEASQSISQQQSSNQNSACVSGGDTSGSCNNFNSQSQSNYGSNALAQSR